MEEGADIEQRNVVRRAASNPPAFLSGESCNRHGLCTCLMKNGDGPLPHWCMGDCLSGQACMTLGRVTWCQIGTGCEGCAGARAR